MIDCGYVPDIVYDVCQHSPHAALLMPSRGEGITAAKRPISEYDSKRGDRIGHFWWIPKPSDRRSQRHFRLDTNYYKSFVHSRFATALGDPGSLSLWGHDPEEHRLFSDHVCAEIAVRTAGQGRTVDEWRTLPDRQDQHYFDCIVGAAAAASFLGVLLPGTAPVKVPRERRRVNFAVMQAEARRKYGRFDAT
jgi:hypothetical protein